MEELVRFLQTVPIRPNNGTNSTVIPRAPTFRPAANIGHVHYYMIVIVWLVAGTIGLWSQLFKQYKCANYLHIICMSIVIIITWMGGFIVLVYFGVHPRIGEPHVILGLVIMGSFILQGIAGIISWSCQRSSRVNPNCVFYANVIHRIFGYIIYILVLIQFLIYLRNDKDEQPLFLATLIICLVSYIGFIVAKFFKKRMQSYAPLTSKREYNIPLVRGSRDLSKLHGNYFIFADKVYDIDKVITNHPGGFDVINNVRGR